MCPGTVNTMLENFMAGSHPVAKTLQPFLRLGKEKTHIPSKEGEVILYLFVDAWIFYVETLRAL